MSNRRIKTNRSYSRQPIIQWMGSHFLVSNFVDALSGAVWKWFKTYSPVTPFKAFKSWVCIIVIKTKKVAPGWVHSQPWLRMQTKATTKTQDNNWFRVIHPFSVILHSRIVLHFWLVFHNWKFWMWTKSDLTLIYHRNYWLYVARIPTNSLMFILNMSFKVFTTI